MAHVAAHLSIAGLEEGYRTCADACTARHYQTIWLLAQGHTVPEVSALTSFAPRWIEELLARYNVLGPRALGDLRRHNGASPSVLKPELLERFEGSADRAAARRRGVDEPEGRRLDGGRTRAREAFAAAWLGSAQGDQLVDPGAASPQSEVGARRRDRRV
jgi:hypothetical protein